MIGDEPRSALVVDDDEAFGAFATRALEAGGWRVTRAATMAEALSSLDASPSIVLLDVSLGLDSGWDCLRRIRARSIVPIVMLTGGGVDDALRRDAELLGAQAILAKPFELAELFAAIERTIDRRSRPG